MTCKKCVFFKNPSIGYGDGECQRYPPTAAFRRLEPADYIHGVGNGGPSTVVTIWPRVSEGDWCGEFKAAAR